MLSMLHNVLCFPVHCRLVHTKPWRANPEELDLGWQFAGYQPNSVWKRIREDMAEKLHDKLKRTLDGKQKTNFFFTMKNVRKVSQIIW